MAVDEGPFTRVSAAGEVVYLSGDIELAAAAQTAPQETCEGEDDTCGRNSSSPQSGYQPRVEVRRLFLDVIEFDAANCETVKNERGDPKVLETWDDFWYHDLGFGSFTRVERRVTIDEQPAGEGFCNKNNPGRIDLDLVASEHDGLCCTGPDAFQVNVRYYPFTEDGENSFGRRSGTIAKPLNVNFDGSPGTYMTGVWQLIELINYEKDTFEIVISDSLWRKVGGVETRWPDF